ncbi:hypothetical protein K443DRAFT_107122, partial [Laccaria amethystina LaAM-08-1]
CPLFHTTKPCSVRFVYYKLCSVCIFLLLQKFVVVRFFISKVYSVRFFRLQNFVMSALFHYKIL